eukprot:3829200-Pyramimonas_sp.AAC.1
MRLFLADRVDYSTDAPGVQTGGPSWKELGSSVHSFAWWEEAFGDVSYGAEEEPKSWSDVAPGPRVA